MKVCRIGHHFHERNWHFGFHDPLLDLPWALDNNSSCVFLEGNKIGTLSIDPFHWETVPAQPGSHWQDTGMHSDHRFSLWVLRGFKLSGAFAQPRILGWWSEKQWRARAGKIVSLPISSSNAQALLLGSLVRILSTESGEQHRETEGWSLKKGETVLTGRPDREKKMR